MTNNDEHDVALYETDAFDNPPQGPVGVHRGKRSAASRFLPLVVVVIVAALCGFLVWGALSGEISNIKWPWSHTTTSSTSSQVTSSEQSEEEAAEQQAAAEKQAEEEAAAKKKQAEEEEAAKKQAEEEAARQAAQVNKATAVRVVNGTNTAGYAATKKSVLDQAGYTSVVAANPTGTLPSATVVWYQNESDKATAQDVANTLGISNVEQTTGLSSSIVVVLLN
ncbi:LytR C-terminal domain-containing protein [Bifidobacterium panos]|uniref:Cell wall integrity and stress response protein 1 n=1 Tax=Bifidobacterium panos TaxID=2675321 RepID=A0ABX1SXL8_9BIFI|nr:LytR C-terminal domain-containing protein [Bifidobacterium sp. DSM 109963]NMN02565.1 cell wall integrity and stress response protein 1 [Bifidobacterium sp. DSM 109963]